MQEHPTDNSSPLAHSPVISIVIAVRNSANTLRQCLDSVLSQQGATVEVVVIDGGSTDGGIDILHEYGSRIAYWESGKDDGIYDAWNKGLRSVKGEWVCFLGADDFLAADDCCARAISNLQRLPASTLIAYGKAKLISATDEELQILGLPWHQAKRRLPSLMSLPNPAVLYRYTAFECFGPFDKSFRIAGDHEMLIRILKHGEAHFMPDVIFSVMRVGGVSSNPENSLRALAECHMARKKNGYRLPGFYWLVASAKTLLRMALWRTLGEGRTRKLLDGLRSIVGLPKYWQSTSK